MAGRKGKILVIDDDAHIRRVVEVKLHSRGYSVLAAKNGLEGLEAIMTERPDVVVSDINMPMMDGETLCKETNHLKKDRPFLTIIMTSRITSDQEEWIKDMQNTIFMEKPFSPNKLLQVIEKHLAAVRR